MGGGREERALGEVLRADEEFMRILHAVADVNPPHWAVGAGVVRDIVWDHLHGYAVPTRHRDVDVAFFDPTDLSPEYDRGVTRELARRLPDIVWDAKNQAAVHTWYEARFGSAVDPLTSVEDAVGTWPETATAVAVRLRSNDELQVIAPCGLSDLFATVPLAEKNGIRLTFSVEIGKARAITGSRTGARQFVLFLQDVAKRYPYATEFIIGNEPNLSRFWQPQFNRRGAIVSASAYQALLGMSYDALKAVNPEITVVGLGLSPRGNGNPKAKSNISTQPVKFIAALGRAYRRSGRDRPIMDVLGFHPYPWRDRDTLEKGYAWPNAGVANLDRIKQAVWDAFNGTAQPVFAEGLAQTPTEPPADPPADPPTEPPAEPPPGEYPAEEVEPLTFKLDEVGWQVRIPASSRVAYYGRESVKPTTEVNQARIYAKLVQRAVCDRSIKELLFFGLVDEHNLDRWQAGLIRADRTPRLSYLTVQNAIAKTGGLCAGKPVTWVHTQKVMGARANFGVPGRRFEFTATADEDAMYKAAVFRVSGAAVSPATRSAIARSLAGSAAVQATATTSGTVRAYWKTAVKLRPQALAPGHYVYGIRFRAAMNPARWSVVVSGAFQVR